MAPTIDNRSTLESLYLAILFTLVRLKLDPRLQPFVPVFEQLCADWLDTFTTECGLLREQAEAEAKVDQADVDIDRTSDGVASVILLETKNNRKSPLFTRYFGATQPSRFRRSVLGPQLAAMRAWPPSLVESKIPALAAYGATLVTQIAKADEALALRAAVEQKITDFRVFGKRKELFNKVNGARKQLHGDVSKLIFEHPEWNLTADFVNALFEHFKPAPELSDADLELKITATAAELAKLSALKEQRIKDDEAAAAAALEEEKKAKLAAIEATKKAVAEATAKIAALEAELTSDA